MMYIVVMVYIAGTCLLRDTTTKEEDKMLNISIGPYEISLFKAIQCAPGTPDGS